MNRIKELGNKLLKGMKANKGYCIVAAALVVLVAAVVLNLNIETPEEHNQRNNKEAEQRKELLASLEETASDNGDTDTSNAGAASGESVFDETSSVISSAQAVSADNEAVGGIENPDAGQEESQNQSSVNQEDTASNSGNQGSSSASAGMSQGGSQSVSNSQNQSQNSNETVSNSQNQSASTNETTSNSQNQSQNTSQNTAGNQNQSQNSNNNQSQGNSSSANAQPEEQYIVVNVTIVCDNVLNHPELSTTATIPSDGMILREKTVVKKGETVLDALKAVCTDYNISYNCRGSASTAYIVSIAGLAEKECGKYSGWKYKVNGVVSGKSCGSHQLADGDEVQWYYATTYTQ